MTYYYDILIASASYRSNAPLTYTTSEKLQLGTIVVVPLKNASVLGVIVASAKKPSFSTKDILEVKQLPVIPISSIKLMQWLSRYYNSSIGLCMQQLLPTSLINKHQFNLENKPDYTPAHSLELSKNQQNNLQTILENTGTYLLRGETGSGKTRVYLELARKSLQAGKSSIILTPEIGLTPQLSRDFIETLGEENILVTHSRLTPSTRNKLWVQSLSSKHPLVIIGPRSALFLPIKNVGLIVIDESHDNSYRQENTPHYNAIRVASQLAKLHKARLVMGSATPDVSDYYLAQQLDRPVLYMPKLSDKQSHLTKPEIKLIDLKNKAQFTRSRYLANDLINEISNNLQKQEQSLLFLNRRGTARITLCSKCGWQALCPNCDLPLTFHADKYSLRCHTCGYQQAATSSCPVCQNTDIHFKSAGTKAIYEELTKLFPRAHIKRFDTDNTKNDLIENHYTDIRDGKVDILIGTQLLVKGLDLPKLSLVAVVVADTTMYLPDYSTDERTYQLLHQVAGRVGRGYLPSKLIVQTYQPNNPVISLAIEQNWQKFYEQEIIERKKFGFPPFFFLLKLTCKMSTPKKAEANSVKLKQKLLASSLGSKIIIDGPTPSFHEKQKDKYVWQLIVKSKNRQTLLDIVEDIPSSWSYYLDPPNLL